MSVLERIHQTVQNLPQIAQLEVLDFAESLASENKPVKETQNINDQRLELMRHAMSDPLFLADLEEIRIDFHDVDRDEAIG